MTQREVRADFNRAIDYGADNDNRWTDIKGCVDQVDRFIQETLKDGEQPPWMSNEAFLDALLQDIQSKVTLIRKGLKGESDVS